MNTAFSITPHYSPYLRVFPRSLQYFFLAALVAAAPVHAVELRPGKVYQLVFTDVDKQQLSTSDGHSLSQGRDAEDESKRRRSATGSRPSIWATPSTG